MLFALNADTGNNNTLYNITYVHHNIHVSARLYLVFILPMIPLAGDTKCTCEINFFDVDQRRDSILTFINPTG